MAGSAAEREIRIAVEERLRRHIPDARIIHELPVRDCRADLAAITRDRIVLVEIKSERDTLDRLDRQAAEFSAAAHDFILVLHQRFFDRTPYDNGAERFVFTARDLHWRTEVWAYPELNPAWKPGDRYRWTVPRQGLRQPAARSLLGFCFKHELLTEARAAGLDAAKTHRRDEIIDRMAWSMTGRQIAEAVCRQLRRRPFTEADAPDQEAA